MLYERIMATRAVRPASLTTTMRCARCIDIHRERDSLPLLATPSLRQKARAPRPGDSRLVARPPLLRPPSVSPRPSRSLLSLVCSFAFAVTPTGTYVYEQCITRVHSRKTDKPRRSRLRDSTARRFDSFVSFAVCDFASRVRGRFCRLRLSLSYLSNLWTAARTRRYPLRGSPISDAATEDRSGFALRALRPRKKRPQTTVTKDRRW